MFRSLLRRKPGLCLRDSGAEARAGGGGRIKEAASNYKDGGVSCCCCGLLRFSAAWCAGSVSIRFGYSMKPIMLSRELFRLDFTNFSNSETTRKNMR